MALRRLGFIDLPPNERAGGFDHAAVHEPTGRIYVAHTANDAVDVIDITGRTYVRSIPDLPAVAGALVAEPDLVFTSNRGENTVGLFTVADISCLDKVAVGIRPNGLAYDPRRSRLHVNIADPPQIIVVESADPVRIRRIVAIPHAGPHGLDIDVVGRRLFCACDAGVLVAVDADTGKLLETTSIAGVPDVVFFNRSLGRLYVAIGDPGVIEVFDTASLARCETVPTEAGAHTLSFDAARNIICGFLPATHRAAVYEDGA